MPHLQSSPGLMHAGHRRRYLTDIFETNIDDWSGVSMEPDVRVEVLGSAKGMGIAGSGRGILPTNVVAGKQVGDRFLDGLDRYFVRLYKLN